MYQSAFPARDTLPLPPLSLPSISGNVVNVRNVPSLPKFERTVKTRRTRRKPLPRTIATPNGTWVFWSQRCGCGKFTMGLKSLGLKSWNNSVLELNDFHHIMSVSCNTNRVLLSQWMCKPRKCSGCYSDASSYSSPEVWNIFVSTMKRSRRVFGTPKQIPEVHGAIITKYIISIYSQYIQSSTLMHLANMLKP